MRIPFKGSKGNKAKVERQTTTKVVTVFQPDTTQVGQKKFRNIGSTMNAVDMAIKATKIYNNAPPGIKESINKTAEKQFSRFANPSGKGKSNHSSGYALTDSPNPMNIKLDTGVVPNTYVSDQMDAVYQQCSPLHMTCGLFVIPQSAASKLYTFLIDQVFHLQTKAQSNVGFALNVATDFSTANILSAMNSLCSALQIYFYFRSIISYFDNPTNNNRGMIFLRRNLTPQLIEDLTLLERRLLDTPIPPNLLEYMRYLSGNFYSGNTAGAPLIKICPVGPNISGIDTTSVSAALANISTTANNLVFTLMRRAIPQWLPKSLYDVPPEPFYDDNFKSIFANLPAQSYYNATTNYIPTVATDSTTIQYNSFTEVLDGGAYCLTAFNVSGTGGWQPGLFQPLGIATSRATSSRISYYVDSANLNAGFYGSDQDPYLTRSRAETYMVNDAGNALYGVHLPGAQICQIVSNNTVRETSINIIEYLFSIETVAKPKIDFVKDQTGRNKRKR